jgi:hypothetical protein
VTAALARRATRSRTAVHVMLSDYNPSAHTFEGA